MADPQELNGTEGKDVVTVTENQRFRGNGGDDEILIERWGTAEGGPGNDVITVKPSNEPWAATVWYWSSRNPIYVDMEAGYALDGFGTRDTLVNVRNVHGFKFDGDRGFGTAQSDYFWIGPAWNIQSGRILIDGRGGDDQVTLSVNPQQNAGNLVLSTSLDKRVVTAHYSNNPGFVFELRNVERVVEWRQDSNTNVQYDINAYVDYGRAGQELLLRGATGWQSGRPGTAVEITYSFVNQATPTGAEGGGAVVPWNDAQRAAVLSVFGKLWQQTGLRFVEAPSEVAQMRLGINQQADTKGYAFLPDDYRNDPRAGDVWLDVETAALLAPGSEGYYVLLHELGHALGLRHPLPESDTSGATVLLNANAYFSNTLMMETVPASSTGTWPSWYGSFDLQALRHLYGTRPFAEGNDVYAIRDGDAARAMTLVDDGGADTLDASASVISAYIDLRPGSFSSVGMGSDGSAFFRNISIPVGTTIESAVGTVGDDHIIGNEVANWLAGNGGNDIIEGGGGLDRAVLPGKLADMRIARSIDGISWDVSNNNGSSGTAQITSVERVMLEDGGIALDLGPNDNAGQALLLLGAVLGRSATLANKPLLGVAISLFDQGLGMQTLAATVMQLPIWGGVFTPSNSSTDIAQYLLTVVNGRAPTSAELSSAVSSLDFSPQGTFLANLATSAANQAQVGLVAQQQTGLEFTL